MLSFESRIKYCPSNSIERKRTKDRKNERKKRTKDRKEENVIV